MAHIAPIKKETVAKLVKLGKEYPIVGLVNMEGLPAKQLQNMREQLRTDVELIMTKKRLMKIVFDELKGSKKGVEQLSDYLKGMPALLFTKENPFKLYKNLQKNKSAAPAKAGQTAPNDIVIPAGPTPFAPGPVIGELGALGVKSGVEGGKVAVKQDTTVAKEGDTITANLAGMLTRLDILPMEVGLDLLAVFEDGVIYDKKILNVDEDEYINNLTQAHTWAFNLAVEAGIHNATTLPVMILNAHSDARSLAVEQAITEGEATQHILARAQAQASALQTTIE